MSFWSLAPMYADVPKGFPLCTTVYIQSEQTLRVDRPGLLCERDAGKELYFDKRACRDLARFLHARDIDHAVLDWEPSNKGDRQGWTPKNRETAEWVGREFIDNGVSLDLWGVPLDPETAGWMARLADNHLHYVAYPNSTSPAFWLANRTRELLTLRKLVPGAHVSVWLCPHYVGGGSGDGLPIPPWREYVGGVMWDAMVKFAEDFGDAGVVWASGAKADGSGYDAFDYKVSWLKTLER